MRIVRLRITGRVQQVGYRAWAIATARRLSLRGWVRNRSDGAVELLAAGPVRDVGALVAACRSGPEAARVIDIEVIEAEDDGSIGFAARPTE
jgi:acylphosphatase